MSINYDKPYYNKLYFSVADLSLDTVNNQVVCPELNCVICGFKWRQKQNVISTSDVFDFNQRVTFTCPNCGTECRLYVAVHRGIGGQPNYRIASELIQENWWIPAHRGITP